MTGGKGTPFLPSSSLTRSPLHRPGSADIHIHMTTYGIIGCHWGIPVFSPVDGGICFYCIVLVSMSRFACYFPVLYLARHHEC